MLGGRERKNAYMTHDFAFFHGFESFGDGVADFDTTLA